MTNLAEHSNYKKDAALALAAKGFKVFPIFGIENGICT
jgi:hypothetical protein